MERSAKAPSGTVTFVFTDIEGSTRRWERDPAAMAAALRVHDAVVRSEIEAAGGYVFKTVGDAFCAAFASPADAFAAARAVVLELRATDFAAVGGLAVRVALMTGEAEERDADYFGTVVNRVARLLGIGHGDQILVGGETADRLREARPQADLLRDLGMRRLKDLERPERVYQAIGPGLPENFPPLRTIDAPLNNLPLQFTSFVGRDDEVSRIGTLVDSSRLVTLVGTGGIGKTRCAIRVAENLLDGSGDGVCFVELAQVVSSALVASAIAHALGLEGTGSSPLDAVIAYVKHKRMLFVFDNCEHLIDDARVAATAMLRACADVRILATSREQLGIAGERVFRMPSLELPAADERIDARAGDRYGALALFSDRANASDGRFRLTDENARTVSDICRRLDGIPLALELAAARVKVMPPQQLAQRLDRRFAVLVGGDRTALPRQQTMRALIDWSYDLLDEPDRRAFRQLAVFVGGFTIETASGVCANEDDDDLEVLERISSLVDKSLVQAEPGQTVMRYSLLESTRQYARERLVESGDFEFVAAAHAETFTILAEIRDAAWEETPDREWPAYVEPDLDNWRAALEWTLEARREIRLGYRLVGALRHMMRFFSGADIDRWLGAARGFADAATPPAIAARFDVLDARRKTATSQYAAGYAIVSGSLALAESLEDEWLRADLRLEVAFALIGLGRIAEGESFMNDVVAVARRLAKKKLLGDALLGLAQARYFSDDIDGARGYFAEALAVAQASGNRVLAAQIAGNLAEAEYRAGAADAALRLARDALESHREQRNLPQQANNLCNIAGYLIALDRFDDARASARDAFDLARDVRYEAVALFSLQHIAAAATLASEGASDSGSLRVLAAQILGYVDVRLAAIGAAREYTELIEYERVVRFLDAALGSSVRAARASEARDWAEAAVVERALEF